MGQRAISARGLPAEPLAAAAAFHSGPLATARDALAEGDDLVLLFDPADHAHRGWRLAAVQDLARLAPPLRVNAIAGEDGPALDQIRAYLAAAPGVTGQVLAVDYNPATEGLD